MSCACGIAWPVICFNMTVYVLFLGLLFHRVNLIKPVSNVCPCVHAYVCLSTKRFFDFIEIGM